jgi:hypothetical protein
MVWLDNYARQIARDDASDNPAQTTAATEMGTK